MTRLYLLIGLLVVTIAGAAVFTYNRAVARVAVLEEQTRALSERLGETERKAELLDTLLAAKVQEEGERRQRRAVINRKVEEAGNVDPEADAYLRTAIPDSVRDIWRDESAGGKRDDVDGGNRTRRPISERR